MESKEALDIIRERIDLAEREYAEQVPEYIEALKLSAELLQADANGQLVVLPCKVGDTVYVIYSSVTGKHPTIFREPFKEGMIPFWGKSVFLTREEAEAALKKMGGGDE